MDMLTEFTREEFINYINNQLSNIFCFKADVTELGEYYDVAIKRTEKCFSVTQNKYYKNSEGISHFSPFHSGQYSIFLYYLANAAHKGGNSALATKIYYLNKVLNCVEWYYEIELPDVFGVEHPVGSVLGRAKYGNGFFVYQGCTVGANKRIYPKMGNNVLLYANATILGNCNIGNNVIVSACTYIKDEDIPDNCIVFGTSPNLTIKKYPEEVMLEKFSALWDLEKMR